MSHYFKKIKRRPSTSFRVALAMEYRPNSGSEKGITMSHYFKNIHKRPSTTTEYRRNSVAEDIGPDSHIFPQRLARNRTTILWDGAKDAAYNSKAARLRSYTNWPHGINPYTNLSTVGFYFSGKKKKKTHL